VAAEGGDRRTPWSGGVLVWASDCIKGRITTGAATLAHHGQPLPMALKDSVWLNFVSVSF